MGEAALDGVGKVVGVLLVEVTGSKEHEELLKGGQKWSHCKGT